MLTISTLLTSLVAFAGVATAIDYPPECPAPPPVSIDSLQWFNGSSSLKCGRTYFNHRSYYCYNKKNPNLWEEPTTRDECLKKDAIWTPVCYNGLPQYPAPWGHGPADTLNYTYGGGYTWGGKPNCFSDLTGYTHHEDFGTGRTDCSGTHAGQQDFSYFYGSSLEESSMARWELKVGYVNGVKCTNGSVMMYTATAEFPLECTIDAQNNATCTAKPFDLTVISYDIYTKPKND